MDPSTIKPNNSSSSSGAAVATEAVATSYCYPIKKIFIQRDYSQGTTIRFELQIPDELKQVFENRKFPIDTYTSFIEKLNIMYLEAEQMNTKICMESCFACITGYLTYLCFDTYFDKCLKKISAFIEEKNDIDFKPNGLMIIDPIERGLRVIEIVVYEKQPQTF